MRRGAKPPLVDLNWDLDQCAGIVVARAGVFALVHIPLRTEVRVSKHN